MTDAVIIGAGLNGLVAAITLARRRKSVVVFDQRPMPGGAAITAEFAPGYRAPTLSHAIGPLSREIARMLRLDRAGVEIVTPDPSLTTLADDNRTIVFHRDPILTAASINQVSAHDAGRWHEFIKTTQRVAAVAAALARQAPPPIDGLTAREGWRLYKLAGTPASSAAAISFA